MALRLSGRGGLKWRLLPVIHMAFRMTGRSWAQFYAWMLNYQDRHVRMTDILGRHARDTSKAENRKVKGLYDVSVGHLYTEFLKKEGLKSGHRLLDFGCGYGRVGVPLIQFLDPDGYAGMDLSHERIRLFQEYIEHEGLQERRPELFVAQPDNDMKYLDQGSFDVIWAHSVFAHMPLADVKRCLVNLAKLLKPRGMVIANYSFSDRVSKTNISAFWLPEDVMREAVAEAGLVYGETGNWWGENIAPERQATDKMMKLRLASSGKRKP